MCRLEKENPRLLQRLWEVGNLEVLRNFLRKLRDSGELQRLCERIGAPSGEGRVAGVDEGPQTQQQDQHLQQQLEQFAG